jgi:hypothetical protein
MLHLPEPAVKAGPTTKRAKPTAPRVDTATTQHSEIIKQCTIYAQSMGAYRAGFKSDTTGNWDYAGAGTGGARFLFKARKALCKLIALSTECTGHVAPLTREELLAKASVMDMIVNNQEETEPDEIEGPYMRFFVAEVQTYLNQ